MLFVVLLYLPVVLFGEETDENVFSLFGNVFTIWNCFHFLFSTFFLVFIFLGAFVDGGGLARKLRVASVQ